MSPIPIGSPQPFVSAGHPSFASPTPALPRAASGASPVLPRAASGASPAQPRVASGASPALPCADPGAPSTSAVRPLRTCHPARLLATVGACSGFSTCLHSSTAYSRGFDTCCSSTRALCCQPGGDAHCQLEGHARCQPPVDPSAASPSVATPRLPKGAVLMPPIVNQYRMTTHAKLGHRMPTLYHIAPLFPIPKSYRVALADPNWRAAMEEEVVAPLSE
jgi:hypothetical protein